MPWRHHTFLIDRFSSCPDKAVFYVGEVVKNGWSRDMLRNFIDTDLYEQQGKVLGSIRKHGAFIWRKVLNLWHENRRSILAVLTRGIGRTI